MRTIQRLATVLLIVVLASAATACTLLGEEPEPQDVADYTGLFHFQAPAEWQTISESGVVAVYAADELPSSENVIDTLSILAFTNPQSEEEDAQAMLAEFVDTRAEQREWEDAQIGEVYETEVGGRPAYRVDIEATDSLGTRFASSFFLVRTSGRDVLIVTVVPTERLSEFEGDIESITENWFWHLPADEDSSLDDEG